MSSPSEVKVPVGVRARAEVRALAAVPMAVVAAELPIAIVPVNLPGGKPSRIKLPTAMLPVTCVLPVLMMLFGARAPYVAAVPIST